MGSLTPEPNTTKANCREAGEVSYETLLACYKALTDLLSYGVKGRKEEDGTFTLICNGVSANHKELCGTLRILLDSLVESEEEEEETNGS